MYNLYERDEAMKNIFKNISRTSRHIIIFGWSAAILTLTASAVIFFGAGNFFDYYPSMRLCAMLLSLVRPVFVISCAASLCTEYMIKQKSEE